MNILDRLKEEGISVSLCARLMNVNKRTLQDHLDVPNRLTETEEQQLKLIIKRHKDLEKELKILSDK